MKLVGEQRALALAVVTYVVVFAAKLVAYLSSGSVALLAESLHTLGDLAIAALLLGATLHAARGADAEHPYGHSRAQYVAALVAGVLFVSFTALAIAREAVPRLLSPEPLDVGWVPIAVLVGSALVAAVPLGKGLLEKRRGPALRAQMRELVNDELGIAAALVSVVASRWGYTWADPAAALVVAGVIAWGGVRLFHENAKFLLGRAPGEDFWRKVEAAARSVEGVRGVRAERAELVAPDRVVASFDLVVDAATPLVEAQRVVYEVRARVRASVGCFDCHVAARPP